MGKKKLNREQRKAIEYKEGPLLIIAGPGTGKTTVLTSRLANLIKEEKLKPEEVLALTFTNKAAEEMEERSEKLLPGHSFALQVFTFHSFAEDVLHNHGLDIGLPNNFKLFNERDCWSLIKKNLAKFHLDYYRPIGNPTQFITNLLKHFSRCQDEGITPEKYFQYAKKIEKGKEDKQEKKRIKELACAYQIYQQLLLDSRALDFGQLLNYVLYLFKKRPAILKKYQGQKKYILIDEFQDTNWVQYQLAKKLAWPQNNITACASSNQAIYQWRGASFANVLQFRKDYPSTKTIILKENYRSVQPILDLSYQFISQKDAGKKQSLHSLQEEEGNLWAKKRGQGEINYWCFPTLVEEVKGVSGKIVDLLQKKKVPPREIAILARTNQALRPFAQGLKRAHVPHQVLISESLYLHPLIIDLLAFLRVLENRDDNISFYKFLTMPFLKISEADQVKIINYSRRRNNSINDVLGDSQLQRKLTATGKRNVRKILALLQKLSQKKRKKVSELLMIFFEKSGCLKELVKQTEEERFSDLEAINLFYNRVQDFENNNPGAGLIEFLQQVQLEQESGQEGERENSFPEKMDSVKIMTVHAAKGLEFEYVFLVGMADLRFPTSRRTEVIPFPSRFVQGQVPAGDVHQQEERRLFYVGITRAKKGLFFTFAEDYGTKRKKKPSLFLRELKKDFSFSSLPKTKEEKLSSSVSLSKRQSKKEKLPDCFSYTQLTNFQRCPWQYKLNHILKVPTRGGPQRSFGKTLHTTLFDFLRSYALHPRTKKQWADLLSFYQQDWIDEWYQDKRQKEEYYQKGKKYLRSFYRDFQKKKPRIKLSDNGPLLEANFKMSSKGNCFRGKIDRLDEIDGGVEIIDYKTGKAKKKLTSEIKDQLLIYQIAAEEFFNLNPKRLTFYYLCDGSRLSFLGKDEEKEKIKKKIEATIKEIQKRSFPAKPGYHCDSCDFKNICQWRQY